jgi:hypothetical protein
MRVFLSVVFGLSSLLATGHATSAASLNPRALNCTSPLFDGVSRYNEELSGAKCFADGKNKLSCFIIADEKKGLQRLAIVQKPDGSYLCRPGPVLATKRGLSCLKGKKPERDFEAIASDGTALYITGSWGNRRKKDLRVSKERWALIRQPLDGKNQLSGKCRQVKRKYLKTMIKKAGGMLTRFSDAPLQCGGLNIEGLAYQNGSLFFGLRSPSSWQGGGAWVLSTSANELFSGAGSPLKVSRTLLHFKLDNKPVKAIGIRALEPLGLHRMLVATGPAGVSTEKISAKGRQLLMSKCRARPYYKNNRVPGPSALWLWTPKTGRLERLGTISGVYGNRKLEGISVLAHNKKQLTLLLVFDGIDNAKMSPLAVVRLQLSF